MRKNSRKGGERYGVDHGLHRFLRVLSRSKARHHGMTMVRTGAAFQHLCASKTALEMAEEKQFKNANQTETNLRKAVSS